MWELSDVSSDVPEQKSFIALHGVITAVPHF
jgi:hypothetical protein